MTDFSPLEGVEVRTYFENRRTIGPIFTGLEMLFGARENTQRFDPASFSTQLRNEAERSFVLADLAILWSFQQQLKGQIVEGKHRRLVLFTTEIEVPPARQRLASLRIDHDIPLISRLNQSGVPRPYSEIANDLAEKMLTLQNSWRN